jgi:hypothetical protein
MKLKWKPDLDSDRAEGLMFKAAEGHVLRCIPKAERWAFDCTCGWRGVHRTDGPALKHAKQVKPTIFDILRRLGRKLGIPKS